MVVVAITGGFVIDAGPFHVSAHRIVPALALALLSWFAAAVIARDTLGERIAGIDQFIDRHAPAAAILLAASAAGVGIAYGTYAAGGSDSAGYVSQAHLLASGHVVQQEPLARQVAWPEIGWTFSPLGYRPGPGPGELVPTYPPGLPLAMAGALIVVGEYGPYLVVPLLGALAVLCTMAIGAALHSRLAGLAAAALLTTSPIFLLQIAQPMSDVPVTAWWALAAVFALSGTPTSPLAAGATAGIALLTRPNLAPLVLPIALLAAGWFAVPVAQRPAMRRLLTFGAGIAPAIVALLLLQWRLYGSPSGSGYGSLGDLFMLANIWPNARGYTMRIVTGETPALLLTAASLAVVAVSRRRVALGAAARLCLSIGGIVVACYLPYFVFAEWWYLRFLLPAWPFVFVLVGALLATASQRLPRPLAGLAFVVSLTIACSFNMLEAARQQAFNLHIYEARYRLAGKYLDTMAPDDAVLLAVQESSSARHYAAAPIVRWDQLSVDPDEALARLRSLGRHPFLLVEDWEAADLRRRFPQWPIARLDWEPRANIGIGPRVLLFDPADRGTGTRVVTDRVR
jgi:hypothetical protein